MSYSISAKGKKDEALAELKSKASVQRNAVSGAAEKDLIDGEVSSVEDIVEQYAGDDDDVAITVNGSMTQREGEAFSISRNIGVTVERNRAKSNAVANAPAEG
jgi:sulfur carrier protein ThiS